MKDNGRHRETLSLAVAGQPDETYGGDTGGVSPVGGTQNVSRLGAPGAGNVATLWRAHARSGIAIECSLCRVNSLVSKEISSSQAFNTKKSGG
jgi:hypothetical protein